MKSTLARFWSKNFFVTFAVFLLASCGRSGISWTEEVRLQSGEIIVVQRTAKTKAFGELGGSGGWENQGMTLEIVAPKKPDNPPIWNYPFVPLVFDQDPETKEWLVVATFYSCTSWYGLGRPKLPYTEYRLKHGAWVQQTLSATLVGRKGNMLTDIRSSGEPHHTLASKAERMADGRITKDYKEVVDQWSTSC